MSAKYVKTLDAYWVGGVDGILKSNIAVKIENPGSKPNQGRH